MTVACPHALLLLVLLVGGASAICETPNRDLLKFCGSWFTPETMYYHGDDSSFFEMDLKARDLWITIESGNISDDGAGDNSCAMIFQKCVIDGNTTRILPTCRSVCLDLSDSGAGYVDSDCSRPMFFDDSELSDEERDEYCTSDASTLKTNPWFLISILTISVFVSVFI